MIYVNGMRPFASFDSWKELKEDIHAEGAHERYHSGDEVEIEMLDGTKHTLQFTWDENGKAFFVWKNPAFRCRFGSTSQYSESEIKEELRAASGLLPEDLIEVIEPYHTKQWFCDEWNETEELLFVPSGRQVFGFADDLEDLEESQFEIFKTYAGRAKTYKDGEPARWWLRSANYANYACNVTTSGGYTTNPTYYTYALVPSFCI